MSYAEVWCARVRRSNATPLVSGGTELRAYSRGNFACRRRAQLSMRVGCALAGASSFFSPPPSDDFLNRSKFESFEMLIRTGRSPEHTIWSCSLSPSCRLVQLREGAVESVGGLSGIGNTAFEAPLTGGRLADRRAIRRNGKCTNPRTGCNQSKRVAADLGGRAWGTSTTAVDVDDQVGPWHARDGSPCRVTVSAAGCCGSAGESGVNDGNAARLRRWPGRARRTARRARQRRLHERTVQHPELHATVHRKPPGHNHTRRAAL